MKKVEANLYKIEYAKTNYQILFQLSKSNGSWVFLAFGPGPQSAVSKFEKLN